MPDCDLVCIVITLFCVLSVGAGEVYTSVAKLKLLPAIEKKLILACDKYLKNKPPSPDLENIRSFLSSARRENQIALDDPTYLENPVNGFRFLWRLVDGWQRATRVRCDGECGADNNNQGFLKQVRDSIQGVTTWPSHEDVAGSAISLANLLDTYDLDIDDVAKGKLLNTKTRSMNGVELFAVADEVFHQSSVRDARMWLNKSIERLEAMRGEELLLRAAHHKLRDIQEKIQHLQSSGSSTDGPDVLYTVGEEGDLGEGETRSHIYRKHSQHAPRGFHQSTYLHLCRRDVKTAAEVSTLTCWYKDTEVPYLKAKVELLNQRPPIMVFHDVINDNEIEAIKNTSRNLLKRSMLGKMDGSGHEGMKERISQSAWVFDDVAVTSRLSRRVQLLTGLSTELKRVDSHAEAFQVLNYGLGGMYEPHEDSVRIYRKLGYETSQTVRNAGDRMATWLFYLSDVKEGGATVFPLLNTRVPVQKGTAAFWFNLKRSGRPDVMTIHAGCPVLIGDKWVANKWIREGGQTFRRRCSLDPRE